MEVSKSRLKNRHSAASQPLEPGDIPALVANIFGDREI